METRHDDLCLPLTQSRPLAVNRCEAGEMCLADQLVTVVLCGPQHPWTHHEQLEWVYFREWQPELHSLRKPPLDTGITLAFRTRQTRGNPSVATY